MAAFDRVAPRYDELWTNTDVGRLQREAVWRHIDPLFRAGSRIVDLGCGTGADAVHLSGAGVHVSAFDASREMVRFFLETGQRSTGAQAPGRLPGLQLPSAPGSQASAGHDIPRRRSRDRH